MSQESTAQEDSCKCEFPVGRYHRHLLQVAGCVVTRARLYNRKAAQSRLLSLLSWAYTNEGIESRVSSVGRRDEIERLLIEAEEGWKDLA